MSIILATIGLASMGVTIAAAVAVHLGNLSITFKDNTTGVVKKFGK